MGGRVGERFWWAGVWARICVGGRVGEDVWWAGLWARDFVWAGGGRVGGRVGENLCGRFGREICMGGLVGGLVGKFVWARVCVGE